MEAFKNGDSNMYVNIDNQLYWIDAKSSQPGPLGIGAFRLVNTNDNSATSRL